MPMTPEQYVLQKGLHCPFCNSCDFRGGGFEVSAAKASQEVTCNECGGAWLDEYQLAGFTPVEIPDGQA